MGWEALMPRVYVVHVYLGIHTQAVAAWTITNGIRVVALKFNDIEDLKQRTLLGCIVFSNIIRGWNIHSRVHSRKPASIGGLGQQRTRAESRTFMRDTF